MGFSILTNRTQCHRYRGIIAFSSYSRFSGNHSSTFLESCSPNCKLKFATQKLRSLSSLILWAEMSCSFPKSLIQHKQRCLTLLGISGLVAGRGLAGPWLRLVEVTLTVSRLDGLETDSNERGCLEVHLKTV